jgi:hypothetical protein
MFTIGNFTFRVIFFIQNWYPRKTALLFTDRQMLCSMSVRKCIRFCIRNYNLDRKLKRFNPTTFCACPKTLPGSPTEHVVVFLCLVSSIKIKSGCSFCWYWWNWWPLLNGYGAISYIDVSVELHLKEMLTFFSLLDIFVFINTW